MTHKEFAARHPHPPSLIYVNMIGKLSQPSIDNKRPPPIDNLIAQPKSLANPPNTTNTHSEDTPEPMEVDKAPMGRTLRKRKEKVAKHLKRGANEKEMDSFRKRVFRIPLEKPFEEAYFTHRLWMFFRETNETEDDIRRMFHQVREKMKNMIILKKKSDPGKFAIPCLVKVMKSQTSSRRINDPELIATCHCGAEYETKYSASIKTHTPTSIDNANQKSIDNANQKSIDNLLKQSIDSSSTAAQDDWPPKCYPIFALKAATSSQHLDEYDEDYEEERATEYRASTNIAYYTSIDNEIDHAKEGNYSIGSWADDHYHERYDVETAIHEPGVDELHEGFTTEELLNHQEHSDTDSLFAEACGRGTRFYRPFTKAKRPSIDNKASTLIDNRPKRPSTVSEKAKQNNNYLPPDEFGIFRDPKSYARAMDGHALQVSIEDIADIL
ncbi:hypothetical protein DY000_02040496 [Brassica cretica]|uniref:Uncharacterized protein n=1 Tax=Brassica cretica TaxID=69181 RepID=A0ABQ7BN76_BRACR|nr:hypothetical protein DY000_02040496 [Brassica cretica]